MYVDTKDKTGCVPKSVAIKIVLNMASDWLTAVLKVYFNSNFLATGALDQGNAHWNILQIVITIHQPISR